MPALLPPRFNLHTHISYVQTPAKQIMTVSYQDDGQPHIKARCLIELICDWIISNWVLKSGFDNGRETENIPWPKVIDAMRCANLNQQEFATLKYQAEIDVIEYVPWVLADANAESDKQTVAETIEGITLDMVFATPANYIQNGDVYRDIPANTVQIPINFELCKAPSYKG